MELNELKKIMPEITQENIDEDSSVELHSSYVGAICWRGNLSDVLEVIASEPDRQVNVDYYFSLAK